MSHSFWGKWGHVILDIGVALACLTVTLYVKNVVTDALTGYLPRTDFESYKREHEEFSKAKLNEIASRFDRVEANQERNSERLQNMAVDVRQLLTEVRIMDRKLDKLDRLGASILKHSSTNVVALD